MRNSVVIIFVLAASFRYAGADEARGPWELTLGASAVNSHNFNGVSAAGEVAVGYFVAPILELSLRQSLQYTDVNVSRALVGFSRFAVDLHVPLGPSGTWVPFIGAGGGYLWGQAVRESAEAGLEAGIKWFVNQDTFIYGMIEYRIFFNVQGAASFDAISSGDFVYTMGIGFRF